MCKCAGVCGDVEKEFEQRLSRMSESRPESPQSRWSHQLGLYRARVDAKADELLRMSRRRQVRCGAACAVLVSALVTISVVVILLAYEYSLAINSGSVQRHFKKNATTHDYPVADQLNRRNFVVDQETFSKMPLLINALQENSYTDPTAEQLFSAYSSSEENQGRSLNDWSRIRKTSPRPFIFEYRTPTPSPFKKNPPSTRNWLDSYRSSQRLKNLEHVINYLQKTVHAKVADLVPSSSDRLVTFSGAFIHPPKDKLNQFNDSEVPALATAESKKVPVGQPFKSDILFKYKPNNPGDINMLADEMFRFSPIQSSLFLEPEKKPTIPIFRPIKYPPRENCYGIKCPPHDLIFRQPAGTSNFVQKDRNKLNVDHSNLLSFMLDIFPMDDRNKESPQLRRKLTKFAIPRPSFQPKLAIPLYARKPELNLFNNRLRHTFVPPVNRINSPPRIHGRVRNLQILGQDYEQNNLNETQTITDHTRTNTMNEHPQQTTPATILMTPTGRNILFTENTSNYSPRDQSTTPLYQISFPTINHSDRLDLVSRLNTIIEHSRRTEEMPVRMPPPPQIVKFNPEDAKFPDNYQYSVLRKSDSTTEPTYIDTSTHKFFVSSTQTVTGKTVPEKSLGIKLKNVFMSSSTAVVPPTTTSKVSAHSEVVSTSTPPSTLEVLTPQINGHYRSPNQNFERINEWLSNEEEDLSTTQLSVSTSEAFQPSYVVINRNNTKNKSYRRFGDRIKKGRFTTTTILDDDSDDTEHY